MNEKLEQEIDRLWKSFADEMEGPHNLFDVYARLARHFAQWGAEHRGSSEIPNDLEEAAVCFSKNASDGHNYRDLRVGFIAGAKWQAEQDQETIELAEDHAYLAGAVNEREKMMIQWTGNNLKDLIDFTGKSPNFGEWFKSWEDFENYVHSHGDILKLFSDDGSHFEVHVGAWAVKTPDKRCVASKFTLKQPESEKIAAAYQLGLADKKKQMMKEAEKPCHTVEEWMVHIKNADQLTKDIFSKGPYNVLYDALNHPYRDCYDAIKEFGELCYQTAREDMMKEAVEAIISQCPGSNEIILHNPNSVHSWEFPWKFSAKGLNKGDKVRVIVVKE